MDSGNASDDTERNRFGQIVRDCPACDGEIELLEELEVWLCGSGGPGHSYPLGHFDEEVLLS